MAVDFKLIGKRIQNQRRALDKTRNDLAEFSSVSVNYISKIENGTAKASLTILSDISDCLELDIGELLANSSDEDDILKKKIDVIINTLNNSEKNALLELLKIYKKYRS